MLKNIHVHVQLQHTCTVGTCRYAVFVFVNAYMYVHYSTYACTCT